jgi:hypothetical protein
MKRTLTRLATGATALGALALTASLPNEAQAVKFSYAAHHPDLDWYSIETEHFVVHYPKSKKGPDKAHHYLDGEYSARKVAEVSELYWEPMCSEFNYYLKEKIHIVLLEQGDELNGFTIPGWDWVQISANPGGSFYRSRGRMEWFSDVLVHEFAHVVSLKAYHAHAEGMYGVLIGGLYRDGINDMDIGVNVIITDGDSVFWTEGGAEFWSNTTGWNWWTASRDQNIRMSTLQDRLLTYEEWHDRAGKRSSWNDSERYYQGGYTFALYLRQRFGSDVYARFATEFSKTWRAEFSSVIEDVIGIPAEELYWDWRKYLDQRYGEQWERVKARGEVQGREMLTSGPQAWDHQSPEQRDEEQSLERWKREGNREKSGRYQWEPRTSPNGEYWGVLNRAVITVFAEEEDQAYAWSGDVGDDGGLKARLRTHSTAFPAAFEHGWDFLPNGEGIVATLPEDDQPSRHPLVKHWEFDGYDWMQLVVWKWPERDVKMGNFEGKTRLPKSWLKRLGKSPKVGWLNAGSTMYEEGAFEVIPNTRRGTAPAVSPDGKRVVYMEYGDGTLNLVTINIDGTDKRYLTDFDDGTWFQNPDWSPDGKQIVFAMFRNYQQNLFIMDVETAEMRPLTWDQWEELDPHWGHDGWIYYSAEPDGVFNIYRAHPETEEVEQVTNVIGGAMTPSLSKDGNLLFTYYTAFGWKVHGLPSSEFMGAPAGHMFRTSSETDMELVEQSVAYREDLSHWAESTSKYRVFKSLTAPSGVPLIQFDNDSMSNFNPMFGAQLSVQDYVQDHEFVFMPMFGEDTTVRAFYTWNGWYPQVTVGGGMYMGKFDGGRLIDEDNDPETTDDQKVYDIKNNQKQTFAIANINYPFNRGFGITLYGRYLNFGFRGTADDGFQTYLDSVEGGVMLTKSTYGVNTWSGRLGASAWYGRNVDLSWGRGHTDVVFEQYGGVATDDGEVLDQYSFNKYEMRYVENFRVPTFGLDFLSGIRENRHTLQLDTQVGVIDRNVMVFDEFRAGGQHPYFFGYGTLRPNTQFAGYPFYSLNGETMGMVNLQYRFPVNQHIRQSYGPLFIHGIFAQFGGTVGNLWSFRPPDDPSLYYRDQFGDRIARNSSDVRREIPFVDEAYKNGNKMLTDVSAELRIQSTMFHSASWDSFVRVAYGFQEIRGFGDVNGDSIWDTSENAIGDELSNETEKPGIRLYVGLGTGW